MLAQISMKLHLAENYCGRQKEYEQLRFINFMVALCTNDIKHFNVQLMHTNYKIPILL